MDRSVYDCKLQIKNCKLRNDETLDARRRRQFAICNLRLPICNLLKARAMPDVPLPPYAARPWVLAETNYAYVKANPYEVAVLPLGATEPHNLHLPYATDTYQCDPLNAMNRAVAIAEWQGPEAGLAVLDAAERPPWLLGYHLWDAVLGDLHRRAGHRNEARRHIERSLALAPTEAEREMLRRRLIAL